MDRKNTNKGRSDKALAHFFSEPIMKRYINRLIPGVFFSWENIGDWGVKNKEE